MKIPDNFTRNGYKYSLLHTDIVDNSIAFAIYEQKKRSKVYAYEVHKLRYKPRTIATKTDCVGDMHWKQPCNEDWGTYGWTLGDYDSAMEYVTFKKKAYLQNKKE